MKEKVSITGDNIEIERIEIKPEDVYVFSRNRD